MMAYMILSCFRPTWTAASSKLLSEISAPMATSHCCPRLTSKRRFRINRLCTGLILVKMRAQRLSVASSFDQASKMEAIKSGGTSTYQMRTLTSFHCLLSHFRRHQPLAPRTTTPLPSFMIRPPFCTSQLTSPPPSKPPS